MRMQSRHQDNAIALLNNRIDSYKEFPTPNIKRLAAILMTIMVLLSIFGISSEHLYIESLGPTVWVLSYFVMTQMFLTAWIMTLFTFLDKLCFLDQLETQFWPIILSIVLNGVFLLSIGLNEKQRAEKSDRIALFILIYAVNVSWFFVFQ